MQQVTVFLVDRKYYNFSFAEGDPAVDGEGGDDLEEADAGNADDADAGDER